MVSALEHKRKRRLKPAATNIKMKKAFVNNPPQSPFRKGGGYAKRARGLLINFAFTLLALFIFAIPSYAKEKPIKVMASIFPVADMARQVGKEHVEVHTILPPGASPHVYEPTPSVMKEFSRAKLFVKVGAGLELWAARLMAAAPRDMKAITLSEGLPLIGKDKFGRANPHVWLDPVLAIEMVKKIEKALSEIDPAHSKDFRHNAASYIKELQALDEEIRREVASFRIKSFVSFHAAWDYFARRYGLINEGVIEEVPGREPTPQKVRNLIRKIKEKDIKAIFAEAQFNPRTAEVIAREAGARVIVLDPEGSIAGESYVKLMRFNLARMKEAMGR